MCKYRTPDTPRDLCRLIANRQTKMLPVDGIYKVPVCLYPNMDHKKPDLSPVINIVDGTATVIDVPLRLLNCK